MCSRLAHHDSEGRDGWMEVDHELLREIATGSSDALSRLYDRHGGKVYGLARRILGQVEDAEEVVQDVFAQVWREANRYQHDRASVAGWMIMLTRTRAIDRLRSRRARPDIERGVEPSAAVPIATTQPSPESAAVTNQDGRHVRAALGELPQEHR